MDDSVMGTRDSASRPSNKKELQDHAVAGGISYSFPGFYFGPELSGYTALHVHLPQPFR